MSETPEKFDLQNEINKQFTKFCEEQAAVLITNHGCVRGAAIVAIDGNGYISIASFGTSPAGVNLLLADALELNRRRQPDVEQRMAVGEAVNELAAGDAPVVALEPAEDAEGAVDATPTQH